MKQELGYRVGENMSAVSESQSILFGETEIRIAENPALDRFESLLDSDPHRANIEEPTYTRMGVGVKFVTGLGLQPELVVYEEFIR